MRGKTGAVRVALETGAPVIPIAQWGAHEILAPYAKVPHVFPRHEITVVAGPPVDLSRFAGQPITVPLLIEATDQVMDVLTGMLEEIRGQAAPAVRHDPRTSGKPQFGNPNAKKRKRTDG